MKMKEDILGF